MEVVYLREHPIRRRSNRRGARDPVLIGLHGDDDEEDHDQRGESKKDFFEHGVCPRLETLPVTMPEELAAIVVDATHRQQVREV